jgi:hypothetical protein
MFPTPKTPTTPPPVVPTPHQPTIAPTHPPSDSRKGATEKVGDRSGPGAGFNNEPAKVKDKGGVAPS